MSRLFEGSEDVPESTRFAVVCSRFNEPVTRGLFSGAMREFEAHGVGEERIDVAWCPGAFEIPLVAKKLVDSEEYGAVVCLGAVVRGETPHFDYVSLGVTTGVQEVALESGVPVLFGVLTADTPDQAWARAGGREGTGERNKGTEAVTAAIEMVTLLAQISPDDEPEKHTTRP